MSREEITLEAPHYADPIAELYRVFNHAYEQSDGTERQVAVRVFFSLFPLSPTSPMTRTRLIRRGAISVRKDQGKAWNSGRIVNAVFRDDPFGLITVLFPATIESSMQKVNSTLKFTISGGIHVDIERLPELLGYHERQLLTDLSISPDSIGYYLQERDNSGNKILLSLNASTDKQSDNEQKAKSPKNNIADMLPLLMMALESNDCGGGGGPSGDACWWVLRSTFYGESGGCWVEWTSRESGFCDQPDIELTEEIVAGPFDSRQEALAAMQNSSKCG